MDDLGTHIYVSANTIARQLSKMADDHFKPFGFTSSYAFLMMAVKRNSGLNQKEAGTLFHLAPSTVTRFVNKLVKMELMERNQDGKEVRLALTSKGH
jgi:DNA-binding MarR family transcriptional regulator